MEAGIEMFNDTTAPHPAEVIEAIQSNSDHTTEDGSALMIEANSGLAPSPSSTALLMNESIDLIEIDDIIRAPRGWIDELAAQPLVQVASTFLHRLSPAALATPWLITSGTRDLSGKTRSDSSSHAAGSAIDIAPMYDQNTILPQDAPLMGLAWNIKSLILLSEGQWGDIPAFVEGDHIHLGADIQPDESGCLPIMWSDSTYYHAVQLQEMDLVLSKLRNSFWRWSTPLLRLEPPSQELFSRVKRLLGHAD